VKVHTRRSADRVALARWALRRLSHRVRPLVRIGDPPAGVRLERDVQVRTRDGVILRVNVYRPEEDGRHPVLLSAQPYGKDVLPGRRRRGGYRPPRQYRLMPQSVPFAHSAWTGWEAPDPAFWVPRGYVVVYADLRGWGRSDGVGELFSEQEALDGYDLVEWAGSQPWSTGRVGLNGVSYLAISQWAAASARPPHLAAICPWEGLTDLYRDWARPGGIREDGFLPLWNAGMRLQRRSRPDMRRQQKARPLFDRWWAARNRNIERIDVPALVCGSFSDHNLHSRGSFEGFRRISSAQKWLYTHRGPKWSTYYSDEALRFQARFFDHFLAGEDNGMPDVPRVRLEVREDADTVVAVRGEDDWPPPATEWRALHLDADGALVRDAPARSAAMGFDSRRGRATFRWTFDTDTEVVGPMSLRLYVQVQQADDVHLFAGIRKERGSRVVGFQGSYGFDRDLVTRGWLTASHRSTDPARSLPWLPFHPHNRRQPLAAGEIAPLDVELLPSATLFRAGETLRLDVQGRRFFPRNPLVGQFPAGYQPSPRGRCVLHCGGPHPAALLLPSSTPDDEPSGSYRPETTDRASTAATTVHEPGVERRSGANPGDAVRF
jgi:predicted acyl esterase